MLGAKRVDAHVRARETIAMHNKRAHFHQLRDIPPLDVTKLFQLTPGKVKEFSSIKWFVLPPVSKKILALMH